MVALVVKLLIILSLITILIPSSSALTTDGVLLLSFKYSILTDPASALRSWNPNDTDPCSWHGVRCGSQGDSDGHAFGRVVELSLPSSQLVGLIPSELALIEFLQVLDLSNNSINGSLPSTFANASRIRFLDLSNNSLTGWLPDSGLSGTASFPSLQFLNLSDNALAGTLPASLSALQNLTVVSLRGNRLFGDIPSQLNAVKVLDLSCNLFNGSLPSEFNGGRLSYLNVSYNSLSGPIPKEFAEDIPVNATVDLSYNNLTGQVPDSPVFLNQMASSFAGNTDLCGDPTRNICPIPSSASPMSSPAIAAIPRTDDLSPADDHPGKDKSTSRLRSGTVIGIVVGDVAGVLLIALVFFYVYYLKKKRKKSSHAQTQNGVAATSNTPSPVVAAKDDWTSTTSTSPDSKGFSRWSCLRKGTGNDDNEESVSTSTETDLTDDPTRSLQAAGGTLVTVDGAKKLELETLLKASAYILGATGSSIMYKAVLEDGTTFAVRRIGESHVERFRDFENQVRIVSKLVHPNLVRIRGFYWGIDEKLIIYDFVPNGSLANARYRKAGSSPCPLPWEARLRIAKGVARGLYFLHEKRHVHGNLKPSNILLGSDMEPKIGDFGLERLVTGDTSYKGGSARTFGSKRSTTSRDMDLGLGPSPSPSPSSMGGLSLYFAPESLRSLKPNPKWDVYSFGVILLELLTGKVMVVDEMGQGISNGLTVEDKSRALRMADVAIRADVEGKEDALLACFKLGYSCASPVPQKRPSMKEAMQVLEKFPTSTAPYLYGH